MPPSRRRALLASIPSDPATMNDRGRTVGFANTLLEINEQVRGLRERGSPNDGPWRYATGTGYVAKERDNKLTPAEYEETTWSARSWTTFAAQKISVALHYAAAFEISMALRVPKFDQAELDAAAARRMAGGG